MSKEIDLSPEFTLNPTHKVWLSDVLNHWIICFPDDSFDFLRLYFSNIYREDRNLCICTGDTLAASLQLLPYQMTFGGQLIPINYLSGCCTHPSFRNRGLMGVLLKQALYKMQQNGILLGTLIPANGPLFDYYARLGFAKVFGYERMCYAARPTSAQPITGQPSTNAQPTSVDDNLYQALYNHLNERLQERPCCVQHTLSDFNNILRDLTISKGRCFAFPADNSSTGDVTEKNQVLSDSPNLALDLGCLALVYPFGTDSYVVGEITAQDSNTLEGALQCICHDLHIDQIEVRRPARSLATMTPLGMARIIDAHELLKRYAAAHPETDAYLIVTDPILPENNGHYLLCEGRCLKSVHPSFQSKDVLTLTIEELALWIFADEVPHMSLMFNL